MGTGKFKGQISIFLHSPVGTSKPRSSTKRNFCHSIVVAIPDPQSLEGASVAKVFDADWRLRS